MLRGASIPIWIASFWKGEYNDVIVTEISSPVGKVRMIDSLTFRERTSIVPPSKGFVWFGCGQQTQD